MKKILTVAVFVFAFALAITPAFAYFPMHKSSSTNNYADTVSAVGANANTGGNEISKNKASTSSNNGFSFFHEQTTCNTCGTNVISTGTATSKALGANVINTNVGSGQGSTNNFAATNSTVVSDANSGNNEIEKNVGGTNAIYTGAASAGAVGINLINTNVKLGH